MRYSTKQHRIGIVELTYLIIAVILLLLVGVLANGQTKTHANAGQAQSKPAVYKEYRGVRIGMPAAEVRAKLGDPVLKSDEQDYYVISPNEMTQIGYDAAKKVTTISTDYSAGAPDYSQVVGEIALLQRPDGSKFAMVMHESERFWVTYNISAATVPVITVTIGVIR